MPVNVRRRPFDASAALCGLLVLAPLLAVLSAMILVCDGRPILFRQRRIGRRGAPFWMLKFRTMTSGSAGLAITAADDPRITSLGRHLRRLKLDELPQLLNVVRGEMNLVGPRPEIPRFVEPRDPRWRAVLQTKPGITDLASLLYRNEEDLLKSVPDRENYYRRVILPEKLGLNLRYLQIQNWRTDLKLILETMYYSILPDRFNVDRVARSFGLTRKAPSFRSEVAYMSSEER